MPRHLPSESKGDVPVEGAHAKHGTLYVEHVHKLVELADRYRVGVDSKLRNDMFKLQDRIIEAMQKANFRDPS